MGIALWRLLRLPWPSVGAVLLGHSASATMLEGIHHYNNSPMPPYIEDEHGLWTPNFAHPLDREYIVRLPTRPPFAARTSDLAGHVGKIVESLQRTVCRVFHALSMREYREFKVSSWLTCRGGCGGPSSSSTLVATPTDQRWAYYYDATDGTRSIDPTWQP